ncbi:MAG: preprotein translocase subunit SecE [Puniceicoccales bacterium]|jgi:preprotein translocase SecE subunit|nr:preprotein translocase subunit SecE [Puniceicoccales bacterium]
MKWWTKVQGFSAETVTELRKVTWPDRKEMRQSIVVVLMGMLLLGCFVSLSDFALYGVVDLLGTWVRGKLGS